MQTETQAQPIPAPETAVLGESVESKPKRGGKRPGAGAIDDNPRLESDLAGPGYELDSKVRILLESKAEMKERGVDSPDDADALALTFARRVAAPSPQEQRPCVRPASMWS